MSNGWVKKFMNWLSMLAWIFRVSKKPTRENYMVILRLGALIVTILGIYSFLFNIAGEYLSNSANFNIPYPLNMIVVLTVIVILGAALILVILSTRGLGRK
ncbi:MAG: hypothetical protein L7G98_02565 [Vulcanisaeta sp.]|nr:hypothetical protein [Vulcanisaeta sp.]